MRHSCFKVPYRFWAPRVPKRSSATSGPPRLGETLTFFVIPARVWSHLDSASLTGSEAPPVSGVPHTDSPYRFSGTLMLRLPQCLRRFPSSEALSRIVDAFQNSEAMSLRRFQSVICLTKSDALSGCIHTTVSASRRPFVRGASTSQMCQHIQARCASNLKASYKDTFKF